MAEIDWTAAGFTDADVEVLRDLRADEGSFDVARATRLWAQWVAEAERGARWVAEELASSYDARDDLDDAIGVVPEALRERFLAIVDPLDRRFRAATVSGPRPDERAQPWQWWRGRIPIDNRARRYLFALDPVTGWER